MRTRPDVKWLINEAAALAGELERVDQELIRLTAHREAVRQAHDACVQTLAYVSGRQSLPGLPTVRAHRQYGGRGKLRAFLQIVLREAAPESFTTAELAQRAVAHFGLTLSCPKELYDFKVNSVGRALRALQAREIVERLVTPHRVKGAQGSWRWRDELPTLADVAHATDAGVGRED